jgi:hypothetical protein
MSRSGCCCKGREAIDCVLCSGCVAFIAMDIVYTIVQEQSTGNIVIASLCLLNYVWTIPLLLFWNEHVNHFIRLQKITKMLAFFNFMWLFGLLTFWLALIVISLVTPPSNDDVLRPFASMGSSIVVWCNVAWHFILWTRMGNIVYWLASQGTLMQQPQQPSSSAQVIQVPPVQVHSAAAADDSKDRALAIRIQEEDEKAQANNVRLNQERRQYTQTMNRPMDADELSLFPVCNYSKKPPAIEPRSPRARSAPTATATASASVANTESCTVCLTEFCEGDKVRRLPCMHFFHVHCIDAWFKARKVSCPMCRGNVRHLALTASSRQYGF